MKWQRKRRKAIDIYLGNKRVWREQNSCFIGMTTWESMQTTKPRHFYRIQQLDQDNCKIETHWKDSSETCYASVSITPHSLPDFAYTLFSRPRTFKLIFQAFWFLLSVLLKIFRCHTQHSLLCLKTIFETNLSN